jgi:hypothetical protein
MRLVFVTIKMRRRTGGEDSRSEVARVGFVLLEGDAVMVGTWISAWVGGSLALKWTKGRVLWWRRCDLTRAIPGDTRDSSTR